MMQSKVIHFPPQTQQHEANNVHVEPSVGHDGKPIRYDPKADDYPHSALTLNWPGFLMAGLVLGIFCLGNFRLAEMVGRGFGRLMAWLMGYPT